MTVILEQSSGIYAENDRETERRRARQLLGKLELLEEHARKATGEDPILGENGRPLSEHDVRCFQNMYTSTYRRLVGVDPGQRDLLREQLEEVEKFGHRSVDTVIESVRNSIHAQRILNVIDDCSVEISSI